MATTDYGHDADWGDDAVSMAFPWTSGIRAVGLCLVRKLQIPRGSIEYLKNTIDLRSYLESNATDREIVADVERVARDDERIERVQVTASREDGVISITILIVCVSGASFPLVLSVTAASVSLLTLQESA